MTDLPEPTTPRQCRVCSGLGYIRCDCWPGDCICGQGDEECEYCDGEGWIYPDEGYSDDDND